MIGVFVFLAAGCAPPAPQDVPYRFDVASFESTCGAFGEEPLWLLVEKLNLRVDNASASGFDLVGGVMWPDYVELNLDCSLERSGDYRCNYRSISESGTQTSVDVIGTWEDETEASVAWSVLYSCADGGLTCVTSLDDESYPCGGIATGAFIND